MSDFKGGILRDDLEFKPIKVDAGFNDRMKEAAEKCQECRNGSLKSVCERSNHGRDTRIRDLL